MARFSADIYLPPHPEAFVNDADGNLEYDGQWDYSWDAENRLIAMETRAIAYIAGAPRQKLEFAYDSQGRRFNKKVYDWDGSDYQLTEELVFIYDGWNLIAELNNQTSPFTVHTSYLWGLDLSGSLQGAGGVGGLLAVSDENGSTAYPTYDGNGNVMGYYAADTGESSAEFEYGPFGELIRATGSKADAFSFRFSTKYEDSETGLLYYGYRYYDAETGRWLSRDPIQEEGGLNLYGFVDNDGINYFDDFGLRKRQPNRNENPSGTTSPSGGISNVGNAETAVAIGAPVVEGALSNPGRVISAGRVGTNIARNLNPVASPTFPFTGVVLPALEEMTGTPASAPWNYGKVQLWNELRRCRIICKKNCGDVFGKTIRGQYTRITERRSNGIRWIIQRAFITSPCDAKCPSSHPNQAFITHE